MDEVRLREVKRGTLWAPSGAEGMPAGPVACGRARMAVARLPLATRRALPLR